MYKRLPPMLYCLGLHQQGGGIFLCLAYVSSKMSLSIKSSMNPNKKTDIKLYQNVTLMLLMANFDSTKCCKKPEKWLKPWHMGTHLRALSESYLMNTNMTGL